MAIEIIVPRLGWSMEEGAFVAWLKKDGERVRAGEALFSIEGHKAVQEIESIDSGILRIAPDCPQAGGAVRVGDVLGHLLAEHETLSNHTDIDDDQNHARALRRKSPDSLSSSEEERAGE